jgi:regulator of protease activity HflC (stomatin/prohibitin superfamily)
VVTHPLAAGRGWSRSRESSGTQERSGDPVTFAFILLIILARSARIISQYEKGLVLGLGRYHATAGSGLNILAPLIDEMIKVDMREQVINVEPQKVITRDNDTVTVDAVIYYRPGRPPLATPVRR